MNESPGRPWTSTTPTGDQQAQASDPIPVETKQLVNMLFVRLMTIYGHKFKSLFQDESELRVAKREWALSLRGYTERDIVEAIDRCKESFVWPPTIAEFLQLLKRDLAEYGLPEVLRAYVEACRFADKPRQHDWSHPAVYYAGRATDWFRLRTEDKPEVFPDFEHHYRQLCRRVIEGESLEVPLPQALPDLTSNSLALYVQQWGEKQGISQEQAATLLYYLQKPEGSPVREHFRQQAQSRAKGWGLTLSLPAKIGEGV
ncbi:replication protein P [Motiliproteus coralliicola]|nr:replication protein P [Motiliproteus coralliicola]